MNVLIDVFINFCFSVVFDLVILDYLIFENEDGVELVCWVLIDFIYVFVMLFLIEDLEVDVNYVICGMEEVWV